MNDLRARFEAIKRHYQFYEPRMSAGRSDEWAFSAYAWDNGGRSGIFLTPIEKALWGDIRDQNMIMYPQYPVGRFFLDFANPQAKVGIECDGAAFHRDASKDRARQLEVEGMGWTIYRISGSDCMRDVLEIATEDGVRIEPSPGAKLISKIAANHPVVRGCLGREWLGPRTLGEIVHEWFDRQLAIASEDGRGH